PGPACRGDRRDRGARDQRADHRGLPVCVAVECARLAECERARRVHRGWAAGGGAVDGTGLLGVAAGVARRAAGSRAAVGAGAATALVVSAPGRASHLPLPESGRTQSSILLSGLTAGRVSTAP